MPVQPNPSSVIQPVGSTPAVNSLANQSYSPPGVSVVTGAPWFAKCDAQQATDAAMVSGGVLLTCATSTPFQQADEGKKIRIAGAGNAAGTLDLITTVAQFINSSQIYVLNPCLNSGGVSNALIFWGTDDTAAIQAAMNAAADGVVKVPAGRSILISSLTPAQCTLDLTGVTVYQAQPISKAAISNVTGNSDVTPITRFHLIGGIFIGTGNEQQNNAPVQVSNITDLLIRDTIVLGYGCYSFYVIDSQRVTFTGTTTSTTGSPPGAVNYMVVLYALNGTASNAPREVICTNNFVLAPNGAADAIGISSSNITNSNSAFPVNAVITGNDFTTNSTPIGVECGGSGATVFYFQRCVVASNVLTCNRTTPSFAIYIRDDSTGGSNDPLLISDLTVVGNVVYSQCGGISTQATRGIIGFNTIRMAGTSTANNGIQLSNHGTTKIFNNLVIGNVISVADGQTGLNLYLVGQQYATVADNLVIYDTGASGSSDAICFQNCIACTSTNNTLRNLPGRGVRFDNCTDCLSKGDEVYNPCTATGNAAVIITSNINGAISVINGYFYDNRGGSAKMTYAINNANSGGTGTAYRGGNFSLGQVTATTNGTWTALTAF